MALLNFRKKKSKFFQKVNVINNKNFSNLILIILIFFVFFQEFNIFRNVYNLINKDFNIRASEAYEKTFFSGYCEGSSHGYLFYIKKKYSKKFGKNEIPKIINNFSGVMGEVTDKTGIQFRLRTQSDKFLYGSEEYWVFSNVNAKISKKQIIILNKIKDVDLNNYNLIDEDNNGCLFIEKKND